MLYGIVHTGIFYKDSSLFISTDFGWTFYLTFGTLFILVSASGLLLYLCKCRTADNYSPEELGKFSLRETFGKGFSSYITENDIY